mmetsp:Transcript_25728/g.60552  ORF Transcript_25728/g.60552 Transcript_25728/m.60552 type:complete len:466 (-) Transcript_25728:164-1561(-)
MVELLTPLSLWIQLASFFFLLSGIYGDLLVIRFFLVLAYIMLLLNAVLGSPLWPDITGSSGTLAWDSLCWAIVSLYVHGSSLWYLLRDEQAVISLSEDEEALWRLLYRTGGLSKRLFQSIVAPHLNVVEFQPGEAIPTQEHFYILYKGQVKMRVFDSASAATGTNQRRDDLSDSNHSTTSSDNGSSGSSQAQPPQFGNPYFGGSKKSRILVSGEMFDLKFLGLLSPNASFMEHSSIACTSITRTKLFAIRHDDMRRILAQNQLAKGIWQALLINQLSFIVETYSSNMALSKLAETQQDRIFSPLQPWEEPKSVLAGSGRALEQPLRGFLAHLLYYIRAAFAPPALLGSWCFGKGHPTGLRQTQLPAPPYMPDKDVEEHDDDDHDADPTRTMMRPRFHTLVRSTQKRLSRNNSRQSPLGDNENLEFRHSTVATSESGEVLPRDEDALTTSVIQEVPEGSDMEILNV